MRLSDYLVTDTCFDYVRLIETLDREFPDNDQTKADLCELILVIRNAGFKILHYRDQITFDIHIEIRYRGNVIEQTILDCDLYNIGFYTVMYNTIKDMVERHLQNGYVIEY